MPYTITSNCISCNRCLLQCPANAIRNEGLRYWIEQDACNDCTGVYSVPQCAAICPTNGGIAREGSALTHSRVSGLSLALLGQKMLETGYEVGVASGRRDDYWDSWFNTYHRLVAQMNKGKQAEYWERWFAAYSQEVSKHIQALKPEGAATGKIGIFAKMGCS